MKTTLDNNQRIFLIQSKGFSTKDIFCNLKDIPGILAKQLDKHEQFVILQYWNRKFNKCSKKLLNDMFSVHKIDYVL